MAILPCDYYVRPINGNDSNDGTEFETKAFKSLQKALDTVAATAGQIKKVGLVCEGDEIITARIDDDTNMIPAAAAVNFLSLNADGSYETNPTLRPTYWISAGGLAITNTDMFQAAVAGNNNKYFENIGFKNCLRDSVILSTGIFGMSFGVLSCKNIGRYALVCATTGTNNYIDFLFVDGCVQAVSGTTTGVMQIKRCFVLNASGVALQSNSTFTYGEIYFSSCANGLRITAKLKVDRIYADNVAGYVFAQAGTNISNVVDRVRAINCGSIFKPEATGNMITCRMLYKYNVTNNTDPTALGVTNIVNSVTMSSSGKAGVAGDGNLTLLESAEYRRIAIPLDANNTYYQETGLPGPDYMRPRITGISDPTADVAGGTVRVITGAGFTGATAVTIGGTATTSFTVDSDTQITATLPAKTAGVYDVAVTVGGVTWTESGLIKYLALAAAPGAFTISAEAWGVNSIKINLNPSTGANSYRVYRDNVDVSGLFVAGAYVDAVSPGTYAYKVKATNETGDTYSNTVTITKVAGGLSDMYSMLSMLYKAIISCRIGFIKEGSTHYLLVYDTDGTTVLSKCAMKTFDGLDIADLAGTTTPSIRNGTTVTGSGEELELSMWDMLSKLFKNEFYKRNKVEYPVGSGHINETLYDNNDSTVIARQLLEKFGGGDIGSLVDTTTPSYRGRSSI